MANRKSEELKLANRQQWGVGTVESKRYILRNYSITNQIFLFTYIM